jgi:hypothetical protein
MTADRLVYVYGIVPATFGIEGAPPGVDGAPLEAIARGEVAALATHLDAAMYDARSLEERTADLDWLAPRAAAHDRVLTWASDVGPVVPLPIFSLFRSEASVVEMLARRGGELSAILARVAKGREYAVRLFRIGDELEASLTGLSPRIAELEREAAGASAPGQRYLRERKLDAARKEELRRVAADVARRAYDSLAAAALAAAQNPLPPATAEQPGGAVMNASFLVAHEELDGFRAAVTSLVREYGSRGFRVEFTGPWPPYHFARSGGDES